MGESTKEAHARKEKGAWEDLKIFYETQTLAQTFSNFAQHLIASLNEGCGLLFSTAAGILLF